MYITHKRRGVGGQHPKPFAMPKGSLTKACFYLREGSIFRSAPCSKILVMGPIKMALPGKRKEKKKCGCTLSLINRIIE
jgi:hypothetical protein